MGKLNDRAVLAAKLQAKQYSLADGDGLTLIVKPNGSKLWWLRYRYNGVAKTLSLGQYPLVTLKEARTRSIEARKIISDGVDPSEQKKLTRQAAVDSIASSVIAQEETVEAIANEWFEKFSGPWKITHASKIIRRLERDLFPWLGKEAIKDIKPAQLLAVLRRVEARGAVDTSHRLLQNCGAVWRYAVATGRVERDITQDLKGALPPAKSTHLGAVTKPHEIGQLLRDIDDYHGSEIVRSALKLAPLVFVRPGELRNAEWSEFNWNESIWVIPDSKMKMKREHIVPLSDQAMEILKDLQKVSGDGKYLFPSPMSKTRCISDMTLLNAIRRMGYAKEEMTAHGFRAMASTNLEQLGFDVRVIELQLAHADTNEIRAAYKRDTSRLQIDQRRKMMQDWADYLDGLRSGADIIPIKIIL